MKTKHTGDLTWLFNKQYESDISEYKFNVQYSKNYNPWAEAPVWAGVIIRDSVGVIYLSTNKQGQPGLCQINNNEPEEFDSNHYWFRGHNIIASRLPESKSLKCKVQEFTEYYEMERLQKLQDAKDEMYQVLDDVVDKMIELNTLQYRLPNSVLLVTFSEWVKDRELEGLVTLSERNQAINFIVSK